jgi:hypothetical protein
MCRSRIPDTTGMKETLVIQTISTGPQCIATSWRRLHDLQDGVVRRYRFKGNVSVPTSASLSERPSGLAIQVLVQLRGD